MRNLLKIKFLLGVALLAIFVSSCDDDPAPVVANDTTITGLAKATPSLSILVQALVKANLATTLQGTGPFTVFAPSNAAFNTFLTANNFTTNGAPDINKVPDDVLTQVLLNHVVSGSVQASGLVNDSYIKTLAKGTASSTNTLSMYVNTSAGVKLNGVSNVNTTTAGATFNIVASNGVIHLVDAVIGLPTIVTHAEANPAFSTLVSVLKSPAQSAVLNALSTNTVPLTVFAPTNAAFTTALGVGGFANGATTAQVTKVLQYHVTAAGNVQSTQLTNGQVIPMITAPVQNITIDLTSGAKIMDTSATKATIVVTNVQCANGIIHAVDKVLQPVL